MADGDGVAAADGQLASVLESNSLGMWDGSCFYLRSFPVWYRWRQVLNQDGTAKRPESGSVNGVDFEQSMGRMVLWYSLAAEDSNISEEEICVEMSSWELKVSVGRDIQEVRGKTTGRKIEPLCGELFADIRRNLSWWEVTEDYHGGSGKWLAIYMTKLEHRAWKGPWFDEPFNPHRKVVFSWNQLQSNPPKMDDDKLARVSSGQPQDIEKELCSGVPPEKLSTGIDEEEDEYHAYLYVHLDEETVEVSTARVPMEELFSADVQESSINIFLRCDGFGLCTGQLKGMCVPQLSVWEITNVRRSKMPKNAHIKCPAFYNPCLRIKLFKAEGHQHLWDGVFASSQKADFAIPRERVSWTERVQRALVLAPGAPLKNHIKVDRAKKMCQRIECSQDTVTQRANITLHLDGALEELAWKFKLDLTTFFSLKVGERMLEVGVIADAEFTMLVGSLGGACEPGKTTWEITREPESPGSEKEHLALKIGLVKAAGSKDRWDEVFKKMEPWEVSESMRQPASLSDDVSGSPPIADQGR